MIKEQWRHINGYNGLYMVSNWGRVKSANENLGEMPNGGSRIKQGRFLSLRPSKDGYVRVSLHKAKKQSMKLVHRLVAEHFLKARPGKDQVNHKNGIKSDNGVVNIEWCTKLENQRHAIKTGLQNFIGENAPVSKLTEQQVKEIRQKYNQGGYTEAVLAMQYEVSKSNINNIRCNRTWKHIL